ncbi:MAG: ABC transporter permease [Acidimicrobiia bacterium]|nr:MAG: ABC transporter permease [Acidimicrobiia bacterium]
MVSVTGPAAPTIPPSKLAPADALRGAAIGLRTRRLRSILSALGIMIGIGAMVAVLGLSESSKSDLIAQLDRLGTNMLQVEAGTGIGLGPGQLPEEATVMVSRVAPVEIVASVGEVESTRVYKNDLVPEGQTAGLTVLAVDTNLLDTLQGALASGVFLDEVTTEYPVTVLGAVTADRLGIGGLGTPTAVWLGGEWFSVVGILDPIELSPSIDRAALVTYTVADEYLGDDGIASTLYVRTDPAVIDDVRNVMPATVNPENPDQVEVTRPSDALEAREAAESTLTNLFLGLGAVALLVGGVGIANVMVISVLERRGEIGLRRALGATRGHISVQFLGESLLLAGIGGLGGVVLGAAVTAAWAAVQGWGVLIPPVAIIGGFVAALLIGAVAGLYPAMRAARVSPTEALRTL